MDKKDIEYFKIILEKEIKLLENELGTVGQTTSTSTPEKSTGWEANSGNMEVDTADDNEVADKMEELEENELILEQLKKQLKEVTDALERINKGTYGICEVGGEVIEKDRLEASPSATTCIKHMK